MKIQLLRCMSGYYFDPSSNLDVKGDIRNNCPKPRDANTNGTAISNARQYSIKGILCSKKN